jgi:type II secretory pathway pseudopilin PulG
VVLGLLALAALPLLLVMALLGAITDAVTERFYGARRAREAERSRLLQIQAQEAYARYRLDQVSVAARQAILDAGRKTKN